jgi:hypothetical protein
VLSTLEGFRGEQGVQLAVMDRETGTFTAGYALDALPVWDGMALCGGHLFLADKSGNISSYGTGEGSPLVEVECRPIEVLQETFSVHPKNIPTPQEIREEMEKTRTSVSR